MMRLTSGSGKRISSGDIKKSSRAALWESLWQESESAGEGSVLDRMQLGLLSRGMPWEDLAADTNLLGQHRQWYDLGLPRAQKLWIKYRRLELARNRQDNNESESSSCEDGLSDDDESFFTEDEEEDEEAHSSAVEKDQVIEHIYKDVPRTYSGLWVETEPFSSLRSSRDNDNSFGAARRYLQHYLPGVLSSGYKYQPSRRIKTRRERILAHLLTLASTHFGYCQGMNFVAAAVSLENERSRSPRDAYALYAYLLKELKLDRLYGRGLASYLGALRSCLERQIPRLAKLFEAVQFEPQLYAVEWFSALFTVSVPKALSLCALDLVFVQFRDAPLRIAIGILQANQEAILALEPTFDALAANFKRIIRNTDLKSALLAAIACPPAFPTCDVLNALAAPPTPASRFLPPTQSATTKQPDVDTPYGPGTIAKVRKDSSSSQSTDSPALLVVNLDWGATAYLENHDVEKKNKHQAILRHQLSVTPPPRWTPRRPPAKKTQQTTHHDLKTHQDTHPEEHTDTDDFDDDESSNSSHSPPPSMRISRRRIQQRSNDGVNETPSYTIDTRRDPSTPTKTLEAEVRIEKKGKKKKEELPPQPPLNKDDSLYNTFDWVFSELIH